MRWWLVSVLGAGAVWACSSDPEDDAKGSANDAGIDAPYQQAPATPLVCTPAVAFEACDASVDPHVFLAGDGGDPDGGTIDASTACAVTNAVHFGCDGTPSFDLAAANDGTTLGIGWNSEHTSRFTLEPAGTLSPMTTLDYGSEDARILAAKSGDVIVLKASSRGVGIAHDSIPQDYGGVDMPEQFPQGDHDILAAALAPDDTLFALFNESGGLLLALPPRTAVTPTTKTATANATLVFPAANHLHVAGSSTSPAALKLDELTEPTTSETPFALGLGPGDTALLATQSSPTEQLSIWLDPKDGSGHLVHMPIVRDSNCSVGGGCGGSCTETVRISPSASGAFVQADSGRTFFLFLEARVTRLRTSESNSNVACRFLGNCGCSESTNVQSAGPLDLVVAEIQKDPWRIEEHTRARLGFSDPKGGFFASRPKLRRDVFASIRGNIAHVGVESATGELERILVDLAR